MSARIDDADMLQRVQAAREGWMVPGSYLVQTYDDAQLVGPLRDRCQLLGRALAAVWSLVGEEDQRAIMAVLDAPSASTLVQLLERKGA